MQLFNAPIARISLASADTMDYLLFQAAPSDRDLQAF